MREPTGILIDGHWADSTDRLTVLDKFTQETIADLASANEKHIEAAIDGAQRASEQPPPPYERSRILTAAAALIRTDAEAISHAYVAETGFTFADANGEIERAAHIFELCAGESVRLSGEEVPLSAAPGSENRLAFTIRIPVGVVAAISPFNAPLSTVAHKVGPAIAAGNGVVLKPAGFTPLSAMALTTALVGAGLPPGQLQLLSGPGSRIGRTLVSDDRVRYVTFTGSTEVGKAIRRESGLARTHLELGSNSVSIVAADADLDLVTRLVARAGFRKAGQVCTSVQRLLVHRSVVEELADRLATSVAALKAGNPREASSDIGPMISPAEAVRVRDWIDTSTTAASRVVGGALDGALLQPTLVVEPDTSSSLFNDEVFGPVVSVVGVQSLAEGVSIVNSGPYGLQTGVFTQDIDLAFQAARSLKVGGVVINDTSSYHADSMPYGGVKESGHGIEGPKYAATDMTDPRIIVLNLKPSTP